MEFYSTLEAILNTYYSKIIIKLLRKEYNKVENNLLLYLWLYLMKGSIDTCFDH